MSKRKWHRDLAALAVLVLAALYFFRKAVLFRGVLFLDDLTTLTYPYWHYVAGYVREGGFPLWCPHLFCGYPLVGNIQFGPFYPVNWAFFLTLPTPVALNLAIPAHYLMGAFFMFLYMRSLGTRRGPSVLAALAFVFNGFMLVYHVAPHGVATMIWLPLILCLVQKAQTSGRWRYTLLGGLAMGMQFLAGHFQHSLYIVFALFVCFASDCVGRLTRGRSRRGTLRRCVMTWLIVGAVSLCVFGIQLLPTWELVQLAARSDLTYEHFVQNPRPCLTARRAVEMVLPDFFGTMRTGSVFTYPTYVGVVVMIFAAFAMLCRRDRWTRQHLVLAGLALALAVGPAPLYKALFRFVPGFSMFKDPMRAMFLFIFAASALSGLGLDLLLDAKVFAQRGYRVAVASLLVTLGALSLFALYCVVTTERVPPGESGASIMTGDAYRRHYLGRRLPDFVCFLVLWIGTLIAIGLYRRRKLGRMAFAGVSVGLLLLSLMYYGRNLVPVADEGIHTRVPPLIEQLRAAAPARVLRCLTNEPYLEMTKLYWSGWPFSTDADVVRAGDGLRENIGLRFRLADSFGFSSLPLRRYLELRNGRLDVDPVFDPHLRRPVTNRNLLKLLNCKYLVTSQSLRRVAEGSGCSVEEAAQFVSRYRPYRSSTAMLDDGNRLYRSQDAMARAVLVHDVTVQHDRAQALASIKNPAFDPLHEVILDEELRPRLDASPAGIRLQPESLSPSRMVVEDIEATEDGVLVLMDTYYPGWRAYVDGQPAPIHLANYLFRAVHLPGRDEPRPRQVLLTYEPLSFKLGLLISAVTLALIEAVLVAAALRGKRNRTLAQ